MGIVRRILVSLDKIFKVYYPVIGLQSFLNILIITFFHYQYYFNRRNLRYWNNKFTELIKAGDIFFYLFILVFLMIHFVIFGMMHYVAKNQAEEPMLAHKARTRDKQRYATYIFIKLIAYIQDIENKYFNIDQGKTDSHGDSYLNIETMQKAHDEMFQAIAQFRANAHKLFVLTEFEKWLPAAVVFGTQCNSKRLRPYSRHGIKADVNLIRSLLGPY